MVSSILYAVAIISAVKENRIGFQSLGQNCEGVSSSEDAGHMGYGCSDSAFNLGAICRRSCREVSTRA
jgi:hypothetical protein